MSEKKLEEWLKPVLQQQDISKYIIIIEGKTNKDDGYLGNIFFVTVNGETSEGQQKSLSLAVKCSKESNVLREQSPVKESFYKEIFVYDRILKTFDNFQKEKGSENFLSYMPHCYATKTTDTGESLILENLKSQGFDVWNRKIPMTYEHVELVLRAYGKWHAFSLALRRKKRDIFDKLVQDNVNMFSYFIVKTKMVATFFDLFVESKNVSIASNDTEVLDKVNFSIDDASYIISDLLFEDPEDSVILHGDCWNNNFLFLSQEDVNKPTDVRILDWQCAGLGSPIMDLSHFIYGCCDTGKHRNVNEVLKIYHESLSECLRYLGCDPEEVFSYKKLVEHWKKFSRYGLLLHGFVIKFSTCDLDDTPDLEEAAEEGKEFLDNFKIDIKNPEEFQRRVKNNFSHYVENLK